MGNVIRYDRAPGESLGMVELSEGHCVVIGNTAVGDPVWLPPEFGGDGEMRRIAEIKRAACPNRDCDREVPHYLVTGKEAYWCAECIIHKFQWYTRRE